MVSFFLGGGRGGGSPSFSFFSGFVGLSAVQQKVKESVQFGKKNCRLIWLYHLPNS